MNCENCNARLTGHLWLVDEKAYCSPKCERGKGNLWRDKSVEKYGARAILVYERKVKP